MQVVLNSVFGKKKQSLQGDAVYCFWPIFHTSMLGMKHLVDFSNIFPQSFIFKHEMDYVRKL